MPTLRDQEIRALLAAIESGDVSTHTSGLAHICDTVPGIRKRCRDPKYKSQFQSWWSKYRKKFNQNDILTSGLAPVTEEDPDPPVPPVPGSPAESYTTELSTPVFKERDRPPPHKGPKKSVQNHPVPKPAPSPPESPSPSENRFDFSEVTFDDEDCRPAATPTSKKSSPKKVSICSDGCLYIV